MKQAILFLATGFEETEAVATIDILRRGGINVLTLSIHDTRQVMGAHGIEVTADGTIRNDLPKSADAYLLPGGMPGSSNLNNCQELKECLIQSHKENKIIAAICAAPIVLGGLGLLKGRNATCYPGFETALIGAHVTAGEVEQDGNIITGKGPGLVMPFALSVVKALRGSDVAEKVAAGLLL